MIVCHCMNISDHDINAAIDWMRASDPGTTISPSKINHALGKPAECCHEVGDYVTMALFESLIADEEGHIDFLETQLDLYERLGAEKYAQLNASTMDSSD